MTTRSRRKGNSFELEVARIMHEADGVDQSFRQLQTSGGRVGNTYHLMLDIVTRRFGIECKAREATGYWVFDSVAQVRERANKHGKVGIHVVRKNRRRAVVMIDLEDFAAIIRGDR